MKKFKVFRAIDRPDLGRKLYNPDGFIKVDTLEDVVNNLYCEFYVTKSVFEDLVCEDSTGNFDSLRVNSKSRGTEIFKLEAV